MPPQTRLRQPPHDSNRESTTRIAGVWPASRAPQDVCTAYERRGRAARTSAPRTLSGRGTAPNAKEVDSVHQGQADLPRPQQALLESRVPPPAGRWPWCRACSSPAYSADAGIAPVLRQDAQAGP